MKMPPQITRIVLLTIAIVGSYLVARYLLTPDSFGRYGWYRANALEDAASLKRVFAGKKACGECHSEIEAMLAKFPHKTLSCEGCHGPGQAHADNPDDAASSPGKNAFSSCIRCHEANPSRPKWHKQISTKAHYTGDKCTECHLPHAPSEVP